MALLTRSKAVRRRVRIRREANNHGLPSGESIRRELVRVFQIQRRAVLHWIETGRTGPVKSAPLRTKSGAGDLTWPGWHSFGLGVLPMADRITPMIAMVWQSAGRRFGPRVGLDADAWSVVDPNVRKAIERSVLAFCADTLATTELQIEDALRAVRAELTAGIVDRGESIARLTQRINGVFQGAETWRARRIAQTEAARAVHQAREMTAARSGVVAGWRWVLSADACPMCKTVARRTPFVKFGQPFAVVSKDPNYGQVKFPPLHPHCNCTVSEVLDLDADSTPWGETLTNPRPEPDDFDADDD